MEESRHKRDVFQIGLLALVVLILVTNAALFLRMHRFQSEILTAIQELGSVSQSGQHEEGLSPGVTAPAFTLQDLDGQEVSLTTYQGSKVLLVFVASQCGACERVYPMLRQLSKSRGDCQILMVSEGPAEEVQAILTNEKLTFPVIPWNHDIANAYEVTGTPFCTVIDENGLVSGSGFVTTRKNLIAML